LFPMLEVPITQAAAVFVGAWEGASAFFSSIIDNMIGGLMELKNILDALWAAMKAGWASITSGDFTGAASAFADAFVETLANQEDVEAKNAFAELGKAFSKGREDALAGMATSGGLGGMLGDRRQELLDKIANDELERGTKLKEVAEVAKKNVVVDAKAAKAKKGASKWDGPTGATGLVDYGKAIQDLLLKSKSDRVQEDQLDVQKNIIGKGIVDLVAQGKDKKVGVFS